ncbi:presequence translocated-associated motor subunit pam17 [Aspergillus heteromorphus CBS 117.55]|uniref:Presequence translocated-associated motor subunit PAM17 n=1 Tax=Aspergillus heteromorphus CBS 117.55 TaxID=1448321 RepID=A0A317WPV2_9EURO|nr:presequence translocated-associated motor subunit pam17 [Aspergillus heteromorphus CBS 117.55]PWY86928.1 presequence translocated-associated motor subunit pam17 [Aspergillus heteromorphus CBS 117.55]
MLSGRVAPTALGPFTHSSSCTTPLYHAISQARNASTSTLRGHGQRSAHALKATAVRTQTPLPSSPILRRANSTAAGTTESVKLDWNSFFKLRASRRRYTLASSIVTSMASTVVGVQILSTQDLESLGAQVMGLDPFVVLGMATAACGAVGWLIGPFVGNAVWGLAYRRYKPSVMVKEKEFFDRIRRFRVDPSSNSIANPVPDYYGEKIGSVQGYRQWLKDQRAYNRKRRHFIV